MAVLEAGVKNRAEASQGLLFFCDADGNFSYSPSPPKRKVALPPMEMNLAEFKAFCIRRVPHLMAQDMRKGRLWLRGTGLDRHVHKQVGRFLDSWRRDLWEGRFRKMIASPAPAATQRAEACDIAIWLLDHLNLADSDDATAVFGSYERFMGRLRSRRKGGR